MYNVLKFTLCEFPFFKKKLITQPDASLFLSSAETTPVQRVQNKEYSATFFPPKKSRVSWAEAADGRQAHKENSESCTSLKLHSAQLCTFSVSLKVWFDIRFGGVTAVMIWKSCCIDKSLFVCGSLTLKSAQQTLCPTASFKLKAQTIPDNWTF